MARTELAEKKQKTKGKKRKHETQHVAAESDDEIANKSLIVEQQAEEQTTSHFNKAKASKRKLQEGDSKSIKEKRSKRITTVNADERNDDVATDDDNETQLPTATLLKEAAKPENTCAVVTVRQKKKRKHEERSNAQKDQNAGKEFKRNEEYLHKWKNARNDWKFEKLRQISIQQAVFDEQKLSMDVWPVALEYLASSSGAAKANLTKLAENVIDKLDKECEQLTLETERQAIFDSARYQRARDLLQSFD